RHDGAQVAVSPPEITLPDEIDAVAYHVVQEALTNAMKHAPGATVDIEINACDGALSIDVRNNPGTRPSTIAQTGSGLGLAGLHERLAEHDGHVTAGPEPGGGFRLRAQLPVGAPVSSIPAPPSAS